MVSGINSCIPPVLRRRVIRRRSRLTLLPINVLTIRSLLDGIVIPEEAALAKFRNKEVDDFLERARFHRVCLK